MVSGTLEGLQFSYVFESVHTNMKMNISREQFQSKKDNPRYPNGRFVI